MSIEILHDTNVDKAVITCATAGTALSVVVLAGDAESDDHDSIKGMNAGDVAEAFVAWVQDVQHVDPRRVSATLLGEWLHEFRLRPMLDRNDVDLAGRP